MTDGNSFDRIDRQSYESTDRQATRGAGVIRPELKARASTLEAKLRPLNSIHPVIESKYLLKGWLDRAAFSVTYGESNVGKTFFALDLALHVAAGQEWHGNKVNGGAVVYVAGEGGAGILNRIEAAKREQPDLINGADGWFYLLSDTLDLWGEIDTEALITALREVTPNLIVIDTLARAMGAGDENTATDMGRFVRNIDAIRESTGAHVMVIHHSGKDASKGARGSSALRAAVDTEIELTSSDHVIMAKTRKQRDMSSDRVFAYTATLPQCGCAIVGAASAQGCLANAQNAPCMKLPARGGLDDRWQTPSRQKVSLALRLAT